MKDLLSYAGKRAVVTGCASGIGRATARALVDLGAEVHGLDLVEGEGGLHAFTRLNLLDAQSIEAAAASVTGRVDALFNCAGVPPGPPPLDVVTINFIGLRDLTEQLLPSIPQGGAVVSVASVAGVGWSRRLPVLQSLLATTSFEDAVDWCKARAEVLAEGYSLSKEAVIAWTLTQSAQVIKQGVRINCTIPGTTQTPMLERIEKVTAAAVIDAIAEQIGRRSSAEEQAWPLLMLNSDAASYVNGAFLPVDGGFTAAMALRTA